MAMKPCQKCLENKWGEFTQIDGWIRATCQHCGNDVEWQPYKKPPKPQPPRIDNSEWKITHEGQPCRKCKTPVVRREHKTPPKYKRGSYYFEHWFVCPNKFCNTMYMVEAAKVWFDGEPPTCKESLQVQLSANIGQLAQVADSMQDGAPPWD